MGEVIDKPGLGAIAVRRCDLLGLPPYSEASGHLTRRYLTDAHGAAIGLIGTWMAEAGMTARLDAAGNLVGRYEAREPDAPALLIGSHIDTVRRAGRYDGALGVMLGLACVEALNASGRRFPFAVEVVAFGDEEGSRFPASMIGSRAMAGLLDGPVLSCRDDEGVSLEEAMRAFGLDVARLTEATKVPGSVVGYVEAHIEQGPVLEAENLAVGVVTAIAAQLRLEVRVKGIAGHAGTTPMRMRRDALAAAAEAILGAENIAFAGGDGLVATVGMVEVSPGSSNVIPSEARFSVDLRAPDMGIRDRAATSFRASLEEIARRREVAIEVETVQDLPACACDSGFSELLADSIAEFGISPFYLPSGAGHDAMSMSALGPVAMLFIRCKDGISHNPREAVREEDADMAARVLLGFIERFAGRYYDA